MLGRGQVAVVAIRDGKNAARLDRPLRLQRQARLDKRLARNAAEAQPDGCRKLDGMAGEGVDATHRGPDRDLPAVDLQRLGAGEPDFDTPWHIREAAIYALERGKTTYTSNLGLLKLREAIAAHLAPRFGVTYDPKKQILIAVGVSEALDIALRAIVNPGDEVIYHEPCYVSYSPSIAMAHGVPVAVSCALGLVMCVFFVLRRC